MPLTPGDIRVAVLMGGRSAEREVSLNTGAQVAAALERAGFDTVRIDSGEPDFVATFAGTAADVAFICLHGRFGEDGTVQGLCELLGRPYVGSGVLASAMALDKVVSKHMYACAGLATPDYVVLRRGAAYDVGEIVATVGEKSVVKPANEGSTIGISIAHSPAELPAAIEEAFRHDATVLVERFVPGAEVTVGVLGNTELTTLPTLEVVPEHEFYDYESKYVPGMSSHVIPARVSEEARAECQRLALEAHRALGCRGMSRSDTIVTPEGDVWLIETNTIPGMTATSLLPEAAASAGVSFEELCTRLVELALDAEKSGR
jgi:D-alanine-D-alanine ligase